MALYSGKTGYIKLGGSASGGKLIAHMSSFSLDLSTNIIEAVSFGNTYKEKIPGIMDWSASADGNCDFANESGQADLVNAYEKGNLVTIGLGITEEIFFEGTAYIESLTIDNSSEDSPTVSISFAGSNAIILHDGSETDFSALVDLISTTLTLVENEYTAPTWTIFAAKLSSAETVVSKPSSTQAEVNKAYNELDAAIKILEKS